MGIIGLEAVVGYYSTFLGKSFNVLCLFRKEAFGNQQREVSILYAGLLEHAIEHLLHPFPDSISIGLYNHTAPNIGLFSEVSFDNELVIPF